MFCGCENDNFGSFGLGTCGGLPPVPRLVACGYDPECYISTAQLAVVAYTTQAAIVARFGGLEDVIAATDDTDTGNVDPTILSQNIINVTSEINGFLSSIYPIPLAKTNTVAILKVTSVSSDGLGAITGIQMIWNGSYQVAPGTTNAPAYLRYLNPLAYQNCWGWNCNESLQLGAGLSLTVAYNTPAPTVSPQTPFVVTGTPAIASGGTGYQVNDWLVLTGGSSFVPDKIQNAANLMVCYELYRRRLTPDEKNNFYPDAKKVKAELLAIGNGELVLDGTYRNFFSPVMAWNQQSVLLGNSL